MKKTLLIVAGVLAVLYAFAWARTGKIVDAELGEGTWAKAKLPWKLKAAFINLLP